MLCYLTLPGGRRRAFTLIKNQLKQSCIDMHQITASQHCLRSLNMIDCNNLIMYQLLVFCLSSLVAVFQCLKWYKCYTWQGVMSRKMPSNCFCQKREKRTKESTLAHAVCGFMENSCSKWVMQSENTPSSVRNPHNLSVLPASHQLFWSEYHLKLSE